MLSGADVGASGRSTGPDWGQTVRMPRSSRALLRPSSAVQHRRSAQLRVPTRVSAAESGGPAGTPVDHGISVGWIFEGGEDRGLYPPPLNGLRMAAEPPRFSDPSQLVIRQLGLLPPSRGAVLRSASPLLQGSGEHQTSLTLAWCSVKTESDLDARPDCVEVCIEHPEVHGLPSVGGPAEAIQGDGVQHVTLRPSVILSEPVRQRARIHQVMKRFYRNRIGGAQRHDCAEPGRPPSRIRRDDHNRPTLDHLRGLKAGVEIAHPQRAGARVER